MLVRSACGDPLTSGVGERGGGHTVPNPILTTNEPMTWADAKLHCEGELASSLYIVHNEVQHEALTTLTMSAPGNRVWLGGFTGSLDAITTSKYENPYEDWYSYEEFAPQRKLLHVDNRKLMQVDSSDMTSTEYAGGDADPTASPTEYSGGDGDLTASPTEYSGGGGDPTASPTDYSGGACGIADEWASQPEGFHQCDMQGQGLYLEGSDLTAGWHTIEFCGMTSSDEYVLSAYDKQGTLPSSR
eukprot:gene19815-23699_t